MAAVAAQTTVLEPVAVLAEQAPVPLEISSSPDQVARVEEGARARQPVISYGFPAQAPVVMQPESAAEGDKIDVFLTNLRSYEQELVQREELLAEQLRQRRAREQTAAVSAAALWQQEAATSNVAGVSVTQMEQRQVQGLMPVVMSAMGQSPTQVHQGLPDAGQGPLAAPPPSSTAMALTAAAAAAEGKQPKIDPSAPTKIKAKPKKKGCC
ncbi:unnamed protein product [Prorocentrum cordatum]|uniref:Uncharacterized protein n=1 Tax=Prorocentrum cordatum TaxID=2364126 RepID=A0ABN9WZQ7_9DINO|nr:unnamed protein product [Polarella glacialis]